MKFLAPAILLALFCMNNAVLAECNVNLLHDIHVNTSALTVTDDGAPVFKIRQGGFLTVEGVEVELSEAQRELVQEYAGDVGALLPQWIIAVSDGLSLAEKSLDNALTTAFGADSVPVQKSARAMAEARLRFEEITSSGEGEYAISSGVFNDIENAFGEEFNAELEEAFLSTVGSVFAEVGEAMMSSSSSFKERMKDFADRMSLVGEELESMGDAMEFTGDVLCGETLRVQALERRVGRKVPALAQYPLFAS